MLDTGALESLKRAIGQLAQGLFRKMVGRVDGERAVVARIWANLTHHCVDGGVHFDLVYEEEFDKSERC
jgi:hypothetical protein